MSGLAMRTAHRVPRKLRATTRAFLAQLAMVPTEDAPDLISHSLPYLANRMGRALRGVRYRMRELEAMGFVKPIQRRGRATLYRFDFVAMLAPASETLPACGEIVAPRQTLTVPACDQDAAPRQTLPAHTPANIAGKITVNSNPNQNRDSGWHGRKRGATWGKSAAGMGRGATAAEVQAFTESLFTDTQAEAPPAMTPAADHPPAPGRRRPPPMDAWKDWRGRSAQHEARQGQGVAPTIDNSTSRVADRPARRSTGDRTADRWKDWRLRT